MWQNYLGQAVQFWPLRHNFMGTRGSGTESPVRPFDEVQATVAAAEADKDDEPAAWSVQPKRVTARNSEMYPYRFVVEHLGMAKNLAIRDSLGTVQVHVG